MRYILALALLFLSANIGLAQQPVQPYEEIAPGVPLVPQVPYKYSHITTDTTTTAKSGAGTLHSVCINTVASTETITIYDNTAASGTKIAVITEASGQSPSCLVFDVAFSTGLTLVTATAAGDLTAMFK